MPGMLMFDWDDEPNMGPSDSYMTSENLYAMTRTTHETTTKHPVSVNFYGYDFMGVKDSATTRISEYCYMKNAKFFGGTKTAVADVMGFDYYPYEYGTKPNVSVENYFTSMENLKKWNHNLFPINMYIETQDVHDADGVGHDDPCGWPQSPPWEWTPDPTPLQLKNLIWGSIIHGAKSLSWFQYFCPRPPELQAVLEEAFAWITDLTQPILSGETPLNVTHAEAGNGRIDIMTTSYDDNLYIFTTRIPKENPDLDNPGTETVTFTVDGLTGGTEVFVYGEGRQIQATDGVFQDTFVQPETHIYKIGGEPPPADQPAILTGEIQGDRN
jgi:hypothetical protein